MCERTTLLRGFLTEAMFVFAVVCAICLVSIAEEPHYDLCRILQLPLDGPIGQLRAVPVRLGPDRPPAILAIYSEDAEIDPYIGMFFFPKGTTKLLVFDSTGKILWQKDLGPGMVSGIWFLPVFAFDLNSDGIDEIYLVNNNDPDHPLDYRKYVLERRDGRTGEVNGHWQWPYTRQAQSMSHTYRNFIMGATVKGRPVLLTAQGTYGPMFIQAWNSDMSKRWEHEVQGGAKGSHVCPVVDIDGDGNDELLWGEHCIEVGTGKELFCADHGKWTGHSDIIQPVLDWQHSRWYIHTCREQMTDRPPRIVCYDDQGNRVWEALDHGHIDTGWAARIGPEGAPIVLGVRVGQKVRTAEGERRTGIEPFTFHAFSGEPYSLNFDPYTTIPVDLNGDGIHELVKGYFEGDGTVLDRHGRVIGNVGGLCAMASKFMDLPGEQILSYSHKKGTVAIWADRTAQDNARAQRRYRHPYYKVNQKLTACGYNLFNLGGL